ncbi:hypothetical protein Btru_060865 [Bulinus truncatus]|nr:hypothetical protein Btru_060865 [Bulinus truncatus]
MVAGHLTKTILTGCVDGAHLGHVSDRVGEPHDGGVAVQALRHEQARHAGGGWRPAGTLRRRPPGKQEHGGRETRRLVGQDHRRHHVGGHAEDGQARPDDREGAVHVDPHAALHAEHVHAPVRLRPGGYRDVVSRRGVEVVDAELQDCHSRHPETGGCYLLPEKSIPICHCSNQSRGSQVVIESMPHDVYRYILAAILPTSNGTILPTIKITIMPTSKITILPTSKITILPTSKITIMPTSKITILSTSKITILPTSKITIMPTSKITILPTSNGTIMPTSNGAILPNSNGAILPISNGAILPTSNGAILPTSNGTILPTSNGAILPNSNGAILPTSNGATLPTSNGAILQTSNGAILPTSNGAILPTSNGAILPTSNGAIHFYDQNLKKNSYKTDL